MYRQSLCCRFYYMKLNQAEVFYVLFDLKQAAFWLFSVIHCTQTDVWKKSIEAANELLQLVICFLLCSFSCPHVRRSLLANSHLFSFFFFLLHTAVCCCVTNIREKWPWVLVLYPVVGSNTQCNMHKCAQTSNDKDCDDLLND